MTTIETLRGFVNAWDCDENAHLNVQAYFRFFADAAEHFLARAGIGPQARRPPVARHVRFHSELRSGQLVRIDSHGAPGATAGRWHLVHVMREPATGRLVAAALDSFDMPDGAPALALASGDIVAEARPRSLEPAPDRIPEAGSALDPRHVPSHSGHLAAHEIDAHGHPGHRAIVARFSDAAAHFWEAIGAPQPWLAEHDYGRVALEMKLSRGQPVEPGPVRLATGPTSLGNKTVSFRHVVSMADSGRIAAVGEVTGLLFDRNLRKAIPLPDMIRAKAQAWINAAG